MSRCPPPTQTLVHHLFAPVYLFPPFFRFPLTPFNQRPSLANRTSAVCQALGIARAKRMCAHANDARVTASGHGLESRLSLGTEPPRTNLPSAPSYGPPLCPPLQPFPPHPVIGPHAPSPSPITKLPSTPLKPFPDSVPLTAVLYTTFSTLPFSLLSIA